MIILGQEIKKGKTYQLSLDIAKLQTRTSISVPVIVSRAKTDGPTLLLNAGVHGDELNGVEIVRRIIKDGHHIPTIGTVICIPVLNVFGFLNHSRKFPDGRDLNRMFPGSKNGSLASQLAYQFRTEIVPFVDIMIDFHTGGAERVNAPQIRIAKGDETLLELAKIFDAPYILYSKTIAKSIRNMMSKLNKTVLLYEGGKSLCFDEEIIQYGVQGVLKVMNHMGMIEMELPKKHKSVIIEKTKWIRSSYSGMFHLLINNGDKIQKKQVLGHISDPYGNFTKKILSPVDGYVFCTNTAPLVNKGDALFNVSLTT